MKLNPLAGKLAPPSMLVNVPRLVTAYYAERPDPTIAVAASRIRDFGASRLGVRARVQRSAHPGHHAGDLLVPRGAPDRWSALHGDGYARAVGAGLRSRARGAGRQRRRGDDRSRSRLHADTGHFARHPDDTTAAANAGSADGIVITPSHNPPEDGGLQIQSAHGRSGRHRGDRLDRETANASWPRTCAPSGACPTSARDAPRAPIATTTSRRMSSDLGSVVDMEAIRGAGVQHRRRSARRRRRALLGADHRRGTGSRRRW